MTKIYFLLLFFIIAKIAYADITGGQFGVNQTFDSQRSPAYPAAGVTFTVSNFATPFDESGSSYTMAAGEYIHFYYVGGTILDYSGNAACNVGIKWRKSGGSDQVISSSGIVYGLSSTGFLYESATGSYGTFVSNNTGYSAGGGTSYTPTAVSASCANLNSYSANPSPLGSGQVWSGTTTTTTATTLNTIATAIARQQLRAPLFYQETVNKQIYNRLSDLRLNHKLLENSKIVSRAAIKLNMTKKYEPIEKIVENKINDYYSDAVNTTSSSLTEIVHQKAQFWTDGTLAFSSKDGSDTTKLKVNSEGFGVRSFSK